MKILIIEDEIKAAKELERILMELDEQITISRIIDSVEDSIAYLSEKPALDLIFSDIQLADGMCFEIFRQVTVRNPIIFCTAFDEYMMEAFDTNAISYLLKPITAEKVAHALKKFKEMKSVFEPEKAMIPLQNLDKQLNYSYKTTILVDHKEKIIPIQIKDIAFFYLDNTVVKITTLKNQDYYLSTTLDQMESSIDPRLFYRANRQFLINKNAIANAERFFARKLVAKLIIDTPESIVISKAKSTEFLHWLEGDLA